MLVLSFLALFSALSASPSSVEWHPCGWVKATQQSNLKVHNLNTSKSYPTIQEAINAPETLEGHKIYVEAGVYHEHVTVNKSLSLIGEDRSSTIIDGDGMGKVVYVTVDNVEVRGFTIQSGTFGLWLHHSQNSRIIGNTLQHGSYGLRLYYSKNSEVIDNYIRGYTWFGVEIESSGNSTLRGNIMVENKYSFGVDGLSLSDFINDIDESNPVNGKPVRYLINQHNIRIDSSTFQEIGYLGIVNSTNVKVTDLKVQDNVQGILMAFTTNSTIEGVNAENNWNGIYVAHSSNVSVIGNSANNNYDYGIKFFNSPHSIAKGNNVDNNGWSGIGVFKSPNSRVEENEANFNTYNLHIVYTNNSVIAGNDALIKPGASTRYSIAIYYSHNNLIYHNTFDNSLLYVQARHGKPFTPTNSWDNGLEGNYWSRYRGVDANLDGIGDTPYVVGQNNVDNYPLMGKFSDFSVTSEGKTYSVSIISNATISHFQFSLDDGRISFSTTGDTGTKGFSRIGVPNELLQRLQSANLTFIINRKQQNWNRRWTDGTRTYFYFLHIGEAYDSAINPWLIAVVAAVLLLAFGIAVLLLEKRLRRFLARTRTFFQKITPLEIKLTKYIKNG